MFIFYQTNSTSKPDLNQIILRCLHIRGHTLITVAHFCLFFTNISTLVSMFTQCWTEGRSSMAVAKDFRPTATATVAEVLGHSYGRRKN